MGAEKQRCAFVGGIDGGGGWGASPGGNGGGRHGTIPGWSGGTEGGGGNGGRSGLGGGKGGSGGDGGTTQPPTLSTPPLRMYETAPGE